MVPSLPSKVLQTLYNITKAESMYRFYASGQLHKYLIKLYKKSVYTIIVKVKEIIIIVRGVKCKCQITNTKWSALTNKILCVPIVFYRFFSNGHYPQVHGHLPLIFFWTTIGLIIQPIYTLQMYTHYRCLPIIEF